MTDEKLEKPTEEVYEVNMHTSLFTRVYDAWDHYVWRPVFVLTVIPPLLMYHRLDELGLQYRVQARLYRLQRLLKDPRALTAHFRRAFRKEAPAPSFNRTPPPEKPQMTET